MVYNSNKSSFENWKMTLVKMSLKRQNHWLFYDLFSQTLSHSVTDVIFFFLNYTYDYSVCLCFCMLIFCLIIIFLLYLYCLSHLFLICKLAPINSLSWFKLRSALLTFPPQCQGQKKHTFFVCKLRELFSACFVHLNNIKKYLWQGHEQDLSRGEGGKCSTAGEVVITPKN